MPECRTRRGALATFFRNSHGPPRKQNYLRSLVSSLTGEQGIEIVRDENPDLVLLDINLPDLDGLKVLERIVAIPGPPPVVMLTVYSDTKLIVAAIKVVACLRLYLFLVNDTVNINIQVTKIDL